MTEKKLPVLSDKGNRETEMRKRREAEALRANLSRRKAQTRSRAEDGTQDAAEAPGKAPDKE
ncbi:MAG: hypothetical protein H7Y60_14800 [Rhodospirillaceae bacterium]|nr:hypothetical protein [Rhodospirillales bacterium]